MSNLVYAFIDSNFNNNNSVKKTYSYDTLPEYYLKTMEHNSKFFGKSFFILQDRVIEKVRNRAPVGVNLISLEKDILSTDEYKIIDELLTTMWPKYKIEVFLYHAFLRLIFVGILIKSFKLTNTIHLEADNIVYYPGSDIFNNDVIAPGQFAYSLVSPLVAAPGIMAFKDGDSGNNFLSRIVKLLMSGEEAIFSAIGVQLDYISDMNFLDVISRGSKYFKLLPSLPFTDLSTNLEKFNYLFDPASYGQYLGGTNNGHEKGYKEMNHYIGRMIINEKINITFKEKPFVIYNDNQYPIYNLHIHNKQAIDQFL